MITRSSKNGPYPEGDSRKSLLLVALLIAVAYSLPAPAADWPGWRGIDRNGISNETGLLQNWKEEGPELSWHVEGIGEGYSGPAVVGDRLFIMGNLEDEEYVFALDLRKEGKIVWSTAIGPVRHDGGNHPGPRATPTVDGQWLYCIGCAGDLVCLDVRNGAIRWRRDLVKDFGGTIPTWGYSESVLVHGKSVVCTPGAADATIVSLNKKTGELNWKAGLKMGAAYSSLVKANLGGRDQYITLLSKAIVGVDAESGTLLWRWDEPAKNNRVKIPTPVVHGNLVFSATGYDTGATCLKVKKEQDGYAVEALYSDRSFGGHEGGFVLVDGHIYLTDKVSNLKCIRLIDGEVLWKSREPRKGSILYADGRLYCRNLRGVVTLVEPVVEEYRSHGRLEQTLRSGKNAWPHPVISRGRLFLRDQNFLFCYDISAGEVASPPSEDAAQ